MVTMKYRFKAMVTVKYIFRAKDDIDSPTRNSLLMQFGIVERLLGYCYCNIIFHLEQIDGSVDDSANM